MRTLKFQYFEQKSKRERVEWNNHMNSSICSMFREAYKLITSVANVRKPFKNQIQLMSGVENCCNSNGTAHEWHPHEVIAGNAHACVVLNRDISQPTEIVKHLWQNGKIIN